MRTASVIKSFKYGLFFSITIMVMTFFVRKVFFDTLGSALTGYYLLINQLLGFLNLAELGLGTASTYLLFKPLHEKDNLRLSVIFSAIRKIYRLVQLAIMIIGLAIAFALPFIVKNSIDLIDLYIPWILFVAATVISYSYSSESILLSADQKLHYVRIINGVGRITCFSVQILLLKFGFGFILFSIIELLSNILQMFFFKKVVNRQYVLKKIPHADTHVDIKKSITQELKKTFIHKVSGVLIFNTDYLIISFFLGLTFVTSYSSYIMLIQAVAFLITTISAPLNAALGNYLHDKGNTAAYNKFRKINAFFFFLATLFTFVYFVSVNDFIRLWLGESVLLQEKAVMLISINCFFLIARSAVDIFKVAYGYMSDIHLPILEGTLNLILSLILVKFAGIEGVIIGTIISNLIIIMLARPYYLYKHAFELCYDKLVKDYLIIWLPALISLVTYYIAYIFLNRQTHIIKVEGFFSLIVNYSIVSAVAAVFTAIVFYLTSARFRELIKEDILKRYGK